MSIREIDPREAKLPKWARETLTASVLSSGMQSST